MGAALNIILRRRTYDADAEAFFVRANITDTTQKNAWTRAVLNLKAGAGLWNRMDWWRPYIGGNETAHSKNAKSNTFNGTYAGTVTHDANGITGNGTDGWEDTGWATSAGGIIATQDSVSIGGYCRTQSPTDARRLMGSANTAGLSRLGVMVSGASLISDGPMHASNAATAPVVGASSDFRGFFCMTRTASTDISGYIRDQTAGASDASVGTCTGTLGILARNFETFGPDTFTNANLAFAFGGGAVFAAEIPELRWIIDTFETALGRNV